MASSEEFDKSGLELFNTVNRLVKKDKKCFDAEQITLILDRRMNKIIK